MTNSAGGIKELYYSNGGTLDLDKNRISSEGGMTESAAKEMGMKANLLAAESLSGETSASGASTAANTGADDATVANVRNWMECVRNRKKPNADIEAGYSHSVALCMTVASIQSGAKATFDDARQEVVKAG